MFGEKVQRTFVAACASILMSSIFIAAAVAPAESFASPVQVESYA